MTNDEAGVPDFDATDFAELATMLRDHPDIATAVMSNNYNIILAALDRARRAPEPVAGEAEAVMRDDIPEEAQETAARALWIARRGVNKAAAERWELIKDEPQTDWAWNEAKAVLAALKENTHAR